MKDKSSVLGALRPFIPLSHLLFYVLCNVLRDEYLNCDLKYVLSEKPAPKNEKQLEENVKNHMKMLTLNKDRVAKHFKHKDIKYVV